VHHPAYFPGLFMKFGFAATSRCIAALILPALIILAAYGLLVEPYRLEVTHLRLDDVTRGKALTGLVVLHLSDLHIKNIGRREKKVLATIEGLQPDIIFLTGDYMRWKGDAEPALEFLSRLQPRIGSWAVMGEYEHSDSRQCCLFCHEPGSGQPTKRHAVRFLRNASEVVQLPRGAITVAGVDRLALERDSPDQRMTDAPDILLSHSPLLFDELSGERDVVLLAGDTHGGQVPLPSWIWNRLGYRKCVKYAQGLFQEDRKRMYVSRGIGTSQIPIRIGRRPELVVLHFEDGG